MMNLIAIVSVPHGTFVHLKGAIFNLMIFNTEVENRFLLLKSKFELAMTFRFYAYVIHRISRRFPRD